MSDNTFCELMRSGVVVLAVLAGGTEMAAAQTSHSAPYPPPYSSLNPPPPQLRDSPTFPHAVYPRYRAGRPSREVLPPAVIAPPLQQLPPIPPPSPRVE